MNPKERFIELLNKDAKQFETMADSLQELLPHLTGNQKKAAESEITIRRLRAQELRLLIERVRNE